MNRDLTPDELSRFLALPADEEPLPSRFAFEERVVRYECDQMDEAKWRLAFEIFLTKTSAPPPAVAATAPPPHPTGQTRSRVGLRKLHLG